MSKNAEMGSAVSTTLCADRHRMAWRSRLGVPRKTRGIEISFGLARRFGRMPQRSVTTTQKSGGWVS